MSPNARILPTFFIWLATTILGVGAMVNAVFLGGAAVVLILAMLLFGAMLSTIFVWRGADKVSVETEKHKRRDKLDKMMSRLSDQEIEDLRNRLMLDADGETSLENLLNNT
jgi:membrane protein implicated in regulation of membrane protease activity